MIAQINFLPEELRPVERVPFYLFSFLSLIACLGLFFLFTYLQHNALDRLRSEKAAATEELASLRIKADQSIEILKKIKELELERNEIERQFAGLEGLLKGRIFWSDIVYTISESVPEGVWLTVISSYDKNRGAKELKGVRVNGMATENSLVTVFADAIDLSPFFKDVVMAYASSAEYKGRQVFSFELNFAIEEGRRVY